MLFVQLFLTFLKIGAFTFGGGYAMVALIQSEVTVRHAWLTSEEFADILAVSQMTPGPLGINTATYTGYTAVINAGYDPFWAILGSVLASLGVVVIPVLLMVLAVRFLQQRKGSARVAGLFAVLRLAVVGLVAAAALQLVSPECFGTCGWNLHFVASVSIFVAVFLLSLRRKNPILLILASGVLGILLYTLPLT